MYILTAVALVLAAATAAPTDLQERTLGCTAYKSLLANKLGYCNRVGRENALARVVTAPIREFREPWAGYAGPCGDRCREERLCDTFSVGGGTCRLYKVNILIATPKFGKTLGDDRTFFDECCFSNDKPPVQMSKSSKLPDSSAFTSDSSTATSSPVSTPVSTRPQTPSITSTEPSKPTTTSIEQTPTTTMGPPITTSTPAVPSTPSGTASDSPNSSQPTVTSSTTPVSPPSESATPSAEPVPLTCKVRGYDKQSPSAFIYSAGSQNGNFAACSHLCRSTTGCQSFAFNTNEDTCLGYEAKVDGNLNEVKESLFEFYDLGC